MTDINKLTYHIFWFFSLILWYSMWHLHKNNIVYFLQVCHVDKSHHTILVQTYTICMDVWMNVDMYYICMYIHMYVCNNKHIIAYKVLKKNKITYTIHYYKYVCHLVFSFFLIWLKNIYLVIITQFKFLTKTTVCNL